MQYSLYTFALLRIGPFWIWVRQVSVLFSLLLIFIMFYLTVDSFDRFIRFSGKIKIPSFFSNSLFFFWFNVSYLYINILALGFHRENFKGNIDKPAFEQRNLYWKKQWNSSCNMNFERNMAKVTFKKENTTVAFQFPRFMNTSLHFIYIKKNSWKPLRGWRSWKINDFSLVILSAT